MVRRGIRGFWTEIRRRHVPRVAAYYVAGAWVAAQVSSLILDAFDAHHLTRYVIAALILGLPVALALAWAFDVTPQGIRRTLAADDAGQKAGVSSDTAAPERSVAVLPFANLSQEPENEYFSDGLSEEIRNRLARVPGLRVAARTSSFAFKGRHEDVREIGRQLNVAAILEGGVRRHEGTVRIDVQLVSARDGFQIWSRNFERRLGDIFSLQSEVAAAVSEAISERHVAPAPALPRTETQNFEAYNAYLLGRHHFHKRTDTTLQRAVECFERAVAADPEFALAYCGLSDACMLLTVQHYGNLSLDEAVARALPAARRALELAPGLAESHASLGLIRLNQGSLGEAQQEFSRALELNPGYGMAHIWLGLVMTAQGRYREAAASNREAFRLDPLSPIINCNVGYDELRFGLYDEARVRFTTAMEIDPAFLVPYTGMSRLESLRGRSREALTWMVRALERAPTRAYYHAGKGLILLELGDLDGAAASVETARRIAGASFFDTDLVIALYVVRGDRAALERIARDDPSGTYTGAQRAQAQIALGDLAAARAHYVEAPPQPADEIGSILRGDWFWRLPHAINYAHLRVRDGDDRGRADLERYIAEADRMRAEGMASPDIRYRVATVQALLGRDALALDELEQAIATGWRDAWWAEADWNAQTLATNPRWRALLQRARGLQR